MEGRKFGKFLRLFVLLALTVALVLAVGIMAFSQGAQADDKECYLAGDMNADGELTSADAVYLYNHVTKGDAEYPVRQDADINGDGLVNEKDASALLYAFYGWKDANPQIGLMVHDYYEPAWTWTEDGATVTAQVTIKCACSEPETLPVEDITSDVTLDIEATCAATGRKVYNARIEVNGQILTSTYTQILPALAHQPGEMVTTDEAQHYQLCIVCDAKVNVADHAWEAYGDVVKGDCQTQSTQKYVCDCGAEKTEQLGLGVHTYVYEMDVPVDENCTYAKQYRCSVCENATYLADEYTNHNYRTVITQPASCQSEGEKASKCDACGHVRSTEVIAANNHNWIEGAVVAGVRTDTCDICFETKTTAVADGAVSKDVLNNSDEVTVGDATMSMDQDVKDNLAADRNVVLSAGTVDKNDLGLSEDQLDQIGDNQVYDFNMVYEDNGEKVDFDGKITISLPYELTGDEDIDAIDVWYIDEEGNAISCEATYNNGYITFEVTHFSYYTVTRLTPRERCERYGHFWTDTSKTATCTTDGYIGQVCQRCNLERNDAEFTPSVIPATDHSYGEEPLETSAAGCTTFGYLSYKCEICAFVSNQAIKPLGHDVQTTTTAATCAAPGKIEHSCSRCDYSRQEVLAQLTHEYEHDEAQDVAVTCTEGGYEIYVCKHCGEQIKKNEKPAKGHNYHKDNAEWTWDPATDEDPYVVVSCSNDGCESTKELTPKVVVTEAGCETESSAVATVYYNGTKFEKSYAKGPALGHDMDTDHWYYNDGQHYHRCNRCGMQEDAADHILEQEETAVEPGCTTDGLRIYYCSICDYTCEEVLPATGQHSMNAGVVTREPTCTLDGVKLYTCELCGYTEKETLPATGHSFVDNVCSACGKMEGCNHDNVFRGVYYLADYDMCGGWVEIYSCDCGQESWANYSFECQWEHVETSDELGEILVCVECGASMIQKWEYVQTSSCTEIEFYICTLLDADGKEIVTFRRVWYNDFHEYQLISVVMAGETCEDGVTKTYTCATCGDSYTSTYDYHHEDRYYYSLSSYGMCGGWIESYVCVCGIQQGADWNFYCDFVTVESAEGKHTLYCEDCGTYMYVTYTEEKYNECITFYEFDAVLSNETMGNDFLSFGTTMGEHSHKWLYELTLKEGSTSCEDGFTVKEYCARCGEDWGEWEEYYHYAYIVDRELISEGLLCGDVEKLTFGCACGRDSYVEYSVEGCHYRYQGYDETLGGDTYLCTTCGTIRYSTQVSVPVEGIGCQTEWITTYHYLRDGEEILTYEDSYFNYNHVYAATFEMQGETCDEGYIVYNHCIYCDYSYERGTYYGCQMFVVEVETKLDDAAYCTTVFQYNYSCPCGEYQRHGRTWNSKCTWEYVYNEILDRWINTCRECGLMYYTEWFNEVIDPEVPCYTMEGNYYYFYDAAGNELCVVRNDNMCESHTWLHTFEMLGETCEDGYVVFRYCAFCDDSYEDGTYYGCQNWLISVEVKLDSEAYCSKVYQYNYDCPCGACAQSDRAWNNNCNFQWAYNETLGCEVGTCTECGLIYYSEWFREVIDPAAPCYTMDGNRYYFCDMDGNALCVVTDDWKSESHTWLHTFEMLGETCEDGYVVFRYCAYCGYSYEYGTYYGCGTWLIAKETKLDSEDFCTKIYQETYSCPCGDNVRYEEYWENNCNFEGNYSEALGCWVYTCSKCGLTYYSEGFNEVIDPAKPCFTMNGTRYYYCDANGNVLCVTVNANKNENHTYLHAFEMLGATCADGYEVTRYCVYCDYSYEYGTYYGCMSWLVGVDVKLDSEDYCTKVYQYNYDCPCGACGQSDRGTRGNCSFDWVYNEILQRWAYTCTTCGLTYYSESFNEVIDPAVPCYTMNGNRYYYCDMDGNALCVVRDDWRNENHTYLYTFNMYGATCADGYDAFGTCMYCGKTTTSEENYGCMSWLVGVDVKLESEDYCSKVYQYNYDCPCGACGQSDIGTRGKCSFDWVYNETLQRWVYTCKTCGLTYYEESFNEVIDPAVPCYTMNGTRYYYYDMDGNALCVVRDDWRNENHTYLYSFNMYGTTCADGYDAFGTCMYCGKTTTSEKHSGCSTWLVSVDVKLESEDYCSKVYQYNYDCPCGACAQSDRVRRGDCSFDWVFHDTLQRWVYTCKTCGLTYYEESFNEVIDPAVPCYTMNGTRYYYYDMDGNALCVVRDDWKDESHTYLYTFHMYGTTCADGYDAFGTCKYCGKTTTSEKRSGCQNWLISVETKVDSADYCGKIEQYNYSCPCGDYFCSDRVWTNNCSFEGKYNAILDRTVYTCTECGLAYTEEYFSEVIDPEKPCYKMNGTRYTYYDKDYNQLCVVTDDWRNEEHIYLYTYQMNGTTCADGYSITGTCMFCDRSYTEGTYTDCNTRRIARYDLTEYGMCGGYVDYLECACGAYSNINYSTSCNYSWINEYNDHGIQGRYCEDCNTTFYWGNKGGINRQECRNVYTYYLTVIRDGETVTDMVLEASSVNHTMLMVGYEGNCGTYVKVYYECKYCGKEETGNYHSEGHGTHLTGFVDLEAGGACGGWISFYQCPCGEYTDYSYNQYGCSFSYEEEQELLPDGNTLYKQTRTCSECGLVLYEEWTEIRDASTCKTTRVRTIWARMGNVELGTFTECDTWTTHRYGDTTYELLDPTMDCEAGLIGKQICLDCGYENTWRTSGHAQYKQNSIDLKQYGSVCGCELEYWACPCGKYQSYRLSEEACDLDRNWTAMWIDNVISGEGQYTTDGWNWFYSDAYTYTCAVTDPQCTLKVRMAEYWLQEGCEAVRYQVWQLGYSETYDSATGQWTYSWDKEIIIATGDRRTWHSYEYTYGSETLDDGTTVHTNSYICSTCGSSYVEKYQYKNGTQVGAERTAINLLNNGKTKQWTEIWFDGFEHDGSFYRTYEKNAYVYADGTEYWNEYTYEYFVDGQCKRVTTWRNSNGESGSYESEHIGRYGKWIWEKYPTCSQSGVELYEEYCVFCHELQYTTSYDRTPYGHMWYMDPDTGIYKCGRCGLENSNGADGTIIMEDLTAAYGNNTNYVVGYYNQGNGKFTVYASVILVDATDENNELVLIGIEFTYLTVARDGICALTADQAAIQAAATAAMEAAGYTGTYAIRIAFVPVDGDGMLDYAITFDSQTAGGNA